MRLHRLLFSVAAAAAIVSMRNPSPAARQAGWEAPTMLVEIDGKTGNWSLLDKAAGVRWPTAGTATGNPAVALGAGRRGPLAGPPLQRPGTGRAAAARRCPGGHRSRARQRPVPCREGLLIPADSRVAFKQTFGTSEYEGCHMNMLGILKSGAALVVSWDDAYVWPEIQSELLDEPSHGQRITTTLMLRRSARSFRLTPLGKRRLEHPGRRLPPHRRAEGAGRHATRKDPPQSARRIARRRGQREALACLYRRMNEASTKEKSVESNWTFDEAAADRRTSQARTWKSPMPVHPRRLDRGGIRLPPSRQPAGQSRVRRQRRRWPRPSGAFRGSATSPACTTTTRTCTGRQSWNPDVHREKAGRLAGPGRPVARRRAFIVCARSKSSWPCGRRTCPAIAELFGPWCYFIDTTYAAGPHECADPKHPTRPQRRHRVEDPAQRRGPGAVRPVRQRVRAGMGAAP